MRWFLLLAIVFGFAADSEAGPFRRKGKAKSKAKVAQKLGGCRACR